MADKYKQAMKEAIASVDSNVILHTLEFRHPAFKDDAGLTTAIRVVRDNMNLVAPLEDDAPLHAGQRVTFIGMPFDVVPPPEDATANPEITIKLGDVAGLIDKYLDMAATSTVPVEVTYRPYLSEAIEMGCQLNKPHTMLVSSATSTYNEVSIQAKMDDILNRSFLWKTASPDLFPTLAQ